MTEKNNIYVELFKHFLIVLLTSENIHKSSEYSQCQLVLGVLKDFYVLRYSELRRHQHLNSKFSQRFYFSSSCLLLPRDVNEV